MQPTTGIDLVAAARSAAPPSVHSLVVSSVFAGPDTARQIGQQAYSYHFVYEAFRPLLERWGSAVEVTRPESRLDHALWRLRQQGERPAHLSFLPLHATYLTGQAPNIVYPFWEFPDLPDGNLGYNPRNNWVRVANTCSRLLTACTFTRDAFRRAGVTTPVDVVPVPIRPEYFAVPAWQPEQTVEIDCPCHEFPQAMSAPSGPDPWAPVRPEERGAWAQARHIYLAQVRRRLPRPVDRVLTRSLHKAAFVYRAWRDEPTVRKPTSATLRLGGVVYTAIFNPFDPRKNWRDLLSAFLLALGDREDATLVLKLVVGQELEQTALEGMIACYRELGIEHRCRVVFVTDYLSDAQMVELAQASTYYVCSSHAEGACLPLQDFLAAGRPGLAPVHTALADYFHDGLGWVIDSHPEPTWFPHDPERRLRTTWHRLVWTTLHEALRRSYTLAKSPDGCHQEVAERGREAMADYASLESVWPRLTAALDQVSV